MKICSCCFKDQEIKTEIFNVSTEFDTCDICKQKSNVVDIDYFSDFFYNFLQLFKECSNGESIDELIKKDWDLFNSDTIGRTIINYFLKKGDFSFNIGTSVCYKIQDELNTWNNLKNNVKVKSRFFSNIDNFDNCNGMEIISSNAKIPKGTKLYRTRIIPIGKNSLSKDEMSCPPTNMATAGRANPLGIPYLYLCAEEETTYYEVRSIYLDRLSIGTFIIEKDLNILDFTSIISPYYTYANSDFPLDKEIYKLKLLKLISADLSKPLRRFDTELEYIPTQLVCEYAKLKKIDGVKFYSSLHKGGINIVLFDPSNATCKKIETKEVKDIKITI